MEIVDKHKPFIVSPITRQIQEYLKIVEEGEVVTYEDLHQLTGFICKSDATGYRYLKSARDRLAKRGCHFAVIDGVGIRKLNPNEAVQDLSHKQQLSGRQVGRRTCELATVDTERLGAIELMEFKAAMLVGRVAARILSSRVKSKLIEEVRKQPTLELDYEKLTGIYLRKKQCDA